MTFAQIRANTSSNPKTEPWGQIKSCYILGSIVDTKDIFQDQSYSEKVHLQESVKFEKKGWI